MKKNLLFFMSFMTFISYADRQQEDFLQAEQLAQNGQYEEALILYNTIMRPGFTVWYNKGICSFYLGKYVDALIAFKKAEKHADRNTYKILEYAVDEVAKKAEYTLSSSWQDTILKSTYYIPIIVLQIFFILILFFSVWAFLYRELSWRVLFLYLVCISQGLYVSAVWMIDTRCQAVLKETVGVHTGPGKEYQQHSSFPAGSVVNVDKKEKNWYKVKSLDNSGWIEETALALIEE